MANELQPRQVWGPVNRFGEEASCFLNEHELKKVDEHEHLGIMITLNWSARIERMAAKARKVWGVIKRTTRGATMTALLWYPFWSIDTTESFHGEAHLWVTIALLWSSSHSLRIEIPSIIRGWELPSLATAATEFLHTHKYYVIPHPKTPVHWAMVHIRISLSKCYTHILRKVIRQWWASIISTRKLQVW